MTEQHVVVARSRSAFDCVSRASPLRAKCEISEIAMHQGDEPNVLVHVAYPDLLSRKGLPDVSEEWHGAHRVVVLRQDLSLRSRRTLAGQLPYLRRKWSRIPIKSARSPGSVIRLPNVPL